MDNIATKIKALLAKAASTEHEGEAELYFSKAYELMDKYQIEHSDLDKDDPVGEQESLERKYGVDWDFRLMTPLARYFGCEFMWMQRRLHHQAYLIGRESARITTEEMHKYLVKTVRKLGRERAKETGEKADVVARRIGVALHHRIERLVWAKKQQDEAATTVSGRNALVTLDAVGNWMKIHHPDVESTESRCFTNRSAQALAAGISLNLQTTKSNQKALGK